MSEGGWIAVGVVRGAFGVQGELKVEPYADIAESVLNHVRQWRIESNRSGASLAPASAKPDRLLPFPLPADVAVHSAKQQGGFIIASIEPAVTREQALALKGAEVHVKRAHFPAADPDEYYWSDLIGCGVFDPAGATLGTVQALDDHGAQAVLRLDNGILIPFVAAFILQVDPLHKRIVADWSADWA